MDEFPENKELTEREIEVVRLLAAGLSNKEIASQLFLSVNTVKVHVRNIFAKLGVQSRTEATLVAIQRGWVHVPQGDVLPLAAPADLPADLPRIVVEPPLAGWRRAVLIVAGLLSVAAVVVSGVKATGGPAVPSDVFSDRAPGANPVQSAPTDPSWRVAAHMPTPRTRLAVASHNGEMVVIGGDTPAGVTDAVERFEANANTWKAGASKPTAVSNVSAAVISGTIYVPGGMTAPGVPTAIVEAYDARADAWTRVASLPAPRMAYAIAALRGELYVLGGWDGSAFASSTYVYDPASDAWNARAPMIAPRGFSAAAVLGDAIYVVGGFDGQVESSVCERYLPRVDRWEVCPSMSVGRGGLALVSVGTNLYAIGGGWTGYLAFNETLTPESGSWRVISTPATGQWRGLGAAVIDSDIFVVGGWNGQYLANTVRYRPFPFKIFVPGVQDSSPP